MGDIPNIWPEGSKLLIEVDMVEEMTSGGIILPPSSRENQQRGLIMGKVLRCGPDVMVRQDSGEELREGTKIIFARYGGFNLKSRDLEDRSKGNRDLRLINDEDVLAILTDS